MLRSSRFLKLSAVSYRSYSHSSSGLSGIALSKAETLAKWKGTSFTGGNVTNYIGGEFVESKTHKWLPVHDPSTQSLLSYVPETTDTEFEQAVEAAAEAFKTWSRTSILTRQRFALESVYCLPTDLTEAN
jgi:malonate-semialdehyde dehydrogenase (acetylating)/methylmalonate-semialdehyde dehydrogenase